MPSQHSISLLRDSNSMFCFSNHFHHDSYTCMSWLMNLMVSTDSPLSKMLKLNSLIQPLFFFFFFWPHHSIWSSRPGIRSELQWQPKQQLRQRRILNPLCQAAIGRASQRSQEDAGIPRLPLWFFRKMFLGVLSLKTRDALKPQTQALHLRN